MARLIQPGDYVDATAPRPRPGNFALRLHHACRIVLERVDRVRLSPELCEALLAYHLVESRRRDDGSRVRLAAHAVRLHKGLPNRDRRLLDSLIRRCAAGTPAARVIRPVRPFARGLAVARSWA